MRCAKCEDQPLHIYSLSLVLLFMTNPAYIAFTLTGQGKFLNRLGGINQPGFLFWWFLIWFVTFFLFCWFV